MNHETDRKGNVLVSGDRVCFKLYPKGTAEGTIKVSARTVVVNRDGSTSPAFVIVTDEGREYPVHSKGVLKLNVKTTKQVKSK